MKSIFYTLSALYFLLFFSCSKPSESDSEEITSIHFSKVAEKSIQVEGLSDWNFLLPQTLKSEDKTYLINFDYQNQALLIYDYDKEKIYKKISFPKEGPNSIPTQLFGFQAFSIDSLFIADPIGNLYLSDFDAIIHNKIALDPDRIPGAPLLRHNAIPAFFHKGNLIVENYFLRNEDRLMKIAVNLNNGETEYFQKLPSEFIKGFYGVGDFGDYTSVINQKTKKMIYNFPNQDSLYVWDIESRELEKVYAGTNLFEHPISEIFDLDSRPSEKQIEEEPLKRGAYTHIFYEPKRDIYFRLIGLPISQTLLDLDDPIKSKQRTYAVMVLDNQFKLLGEFMLPEYEYLINTERTFANEHGIHFQKESENEDIAVFDVWNVTSK